MTNGYDVGIIDYNKWEPITTKDVEKKTSTAVNTTQAPPNINTEDVNLERIPENDKLESSKCTDGKDDGKISLFSKIGNTIKGIGKGLCNMVKSIVKHPIKTALTIGVCCIPYVGPVIAAGLAGYGIFNGVKNVAVGIKQANSAQTDAEAKEAWNNIGNGTFTTAASALALKGSVGVLKGQVSGGAGATNTYNAIKSNAGIKNIGKSVLKDTASNANAIKNGVVDKTKQSYEYVKENGVSGTLKNGFDKIGEKATNVPKKFNEGLDSAKIKIEDLKSRGGNAKALMDEAVIEGGKINGTYKNGIPKEIQMADGTIIKFDRFGKVTSTTEMTANAGTLKVKTVSGNTTKTSTSNNSSINEITKNSTTGIQKHTTLRMNENGAINSANYGKMNANTTSGYSTTLSNDAGVVSRNTTYIIDGKPYSAAELNALQKLNIRFNTTNTGSTINKFVDTKLPISDKTLMYGSSIIDE